MFVPCFPASSEAGKQASATHSQDRTSQHTYAQIVDQEGSRSLVLVGTVGKPGSSLKSDSNIEAAKFIGKIGKKVAELALAKGIEKVVFDRSGYLYHGRVKALADAALP